MAELSPEVLGHFGDGVDSDAVEVVGLHEVLNPIFQLLSYVRVFLFKIRKSSESAILHLLLVVPVIDVAVSMVVFRLVERHYLAEVVADWPNVVGDYIHHHPDVLGVCGTHQVLQALVTSEIGVDLGPVTSPVTVETVGSVVYDRGDPDGVET